MDNSVWQAKPRNEKLFGVLKSKYSKLEAEILSRRELTDEKELEEYLSPKFEGLYDPFLLLNMKKVITRYFSAISKKEKVAIYADYDADGICSGALLTDIVKLSFSDFEIYIPDRKLEGYGLKKKAIEFLWKKGVSLIISCDCGISNKEEIDYAKKLGVDVIVLDHHDPPDYNFSNYYIIDPKLKNDKYKDKNICGGGVVYKFIQAVIIANQNEKLIKFPEHFAKWSLDLVGIATIADMVPLKKENRIFAKYGLVVLNKTKRIGIKELVKRSGLDKEIIDTRNVGYVIAPRLNAAGRIDHANSSYKLLVSQDKKEAKTIASELNIKNSSRQELTNQVYIEAIENAKKESGNIIVLKSKKWDSGVLGIAASRITNELNKPTILMTENKDEITGSARSIKNFNIIEAIRKHKDLLITFGGHPQAAGLTVEKSNFESFKEKMIKHTAKKISKADLIKLYEYDVETDLDNINYSLYKTIELLEPFGMGNKKPIFLLNNLIIEKYNFVGKKENHLKLNLRSGRKRISAIKFNIEKNKIENILKKEKLDVLVELSENKYMGRSSLELQLIDLK
ncbi:MAG: single-stranded-DNA-specific exonuclease RecJ [bacterium]